MYVYIYIYNCYYSYYYYSIYKESGGAAADALCGARAASTPLHPVPTGSTTRYYLLVVY